MKTLHHSEIPISHVDMEGAKEVGKQVLISPEDGAPNFSMRRFTVGKGGHTPRHTHDNEHEIFVLEGKGILFYQGKEYPLKPGTFAYVEPSSLHQFINDGDGDLVFLCLVPNK